MDPSTSVGLIPHVHLPFADILRQQIESLGTSFEFGTTDVTLIPRLEGLGPEDEIHLDLYGLWPPIPVPVELDESEFLYIVHAMPSDEDTPSYAYLFTMKIGSTEGRSAVYTLNDENEWENHGHTPPSEVEADLELFAFALDG